MKISNFLLYGKEFFLRLLFIKCTTYPGFAFGYARVSQFPGEIGWRQVEQGFYSFFAKGFVCAIIWHYLQIRGKTNREIDLFIL